jgi:CelD/BcsL family acetyltransferase involved in cellulose biosynthesis
MRSAQSLPELANRAEPAVNIERWRGDLDELGPTWTELFDPSHPGAVFRSWAWISAWWKNFSLGREPFVLVARAGDAPIGILPLYTEPAPLGGRRLALMGEGIVGSDYLGIACRAGDQKHLARRFAAHLGGEAFDELCLDGLERHDPLLPALEGVIAATRATVEPRYRCPHIAISGEFETYLAGLPEGTGAQWKRRLRWLEKQRGFAIDCLHRPDEIAWGLEALFTLHQLRWSAEGGSDAIDRPAIEVFHRQAGRALAQAGWARLYLLHVDGAPRAALYGFRHGDRFVFYQAGYDPEWRRRSVGTVLLGHIVRDCFAARLAEFDFLRGTEPYKLHWANRCRETVRLRARDASWRAFFHDAGLSAYWRLRTAAKRALPDVALAWARRRRKRASA